MITKATIKDIPLIQDLAEKSWRSHYPGIISPEQIDFMLNLMYSEEEITRQFNNPNYHYYLLGDAENFYGIMGFEIITNKTLLNSIESTLPKKEKEKV